MTSSSIKAKWQRCEGGKMCSLEGVPTDHAHFDNLTGIVVVCFKDKKGIATLVIGKGSVREEIEKFRKNKMVNIYAQRVKLYVTWAEIEPSLLDGVEAFLHNNYQPELSRIASRAQPIKINLPY